MSVKVAGNGGVVAEVDADRQLLVSTNQDPQKAGAVVLFSENDDGTKTGARYLQSPETSDDYRLRVGVDTLFDSETFAYASQNTAKHFYRLTTMTMVLSGGALTTNGLSVNTTALAVALNTNKYFPLFTAAPTYAEAKFALTNIPGANTIIDFGLAIPGAANPYTPTDGCLFRYTSAGLLGVVNNNGTELTTLLDFTPVVNVVNHYIITVYQDEVEFWIDGVLYGAVATPSGQGTPLLSASAPFMIRQAHVGGAAGAIVQGKLFAYGVSVGDLFMGKPWQAQTAGMGGNSAQGQSGQTQGSTHVFPANSAAIATTVPTNTTNTAVGLGGRTQVALIASATTDLILFGYQNPAGTAVIPGKSLYLKRIKITGAVTTLLVAPTAGIPLLSFDLGYGSTAVTLATTESASFAATTKKARLIPIGHMGFSAGVQTVTAPVAGSVGNELDFDFEAPVVVNPGEWVQVVMRCVNCGAGGLVSLAASINGYFE